MTEKQYVELVKYGYKVINYYTKKLNYQEKEDIISDALIALLTNNIEILNIKTYFGKIVQNLTLKYLKSGYKKNIDYPEVLEIQIEDIKYEELKTDLSKLDKKTLNILTDKIINKLSTKEIKSKYKIKSMETIYRQSKNMLKGKQVYKGLARLISGKIDKIYPNIASVTKDGFNSTTISKCVNGKLKTYISNGYEWRFIKDIDEKTKERKTA